MPYAIDFGTSNTVISRWNPAMGGPETLKLPGLSQVLGNNPPLIPSLVYVEDARRGRVIAGQAVRDRGLDLRADPRFFRSFKRGIGAAIQGFLPELDEKIITFEQVGEWFLGQSIEKLNREAGGELDSLILTVPVDSFETYRHWLSHACQAWSSQEVRMVDEPTAAALGYGTSAANLLLVVDFGGGTLDFSLVQLDLDQPQTPQGFILKWGERFLGSQPAQKAKLARVLAKAGANLGGSDLDDWLLDYFAQRQGLPKSTLTVRLAERLKIELSSQLHAREVYFNDETFDSFELELDRESFEGILQQRGFFDQLDDLMAQVLQQGRRSGIEARDVEAVLLVGGTGQIPAVQRWIGQYFDAAKIRCDRPFEAIALGALQLARGFELQDFLYHSYGIRYWNRRKNCHSWHPIVPAGQPYPTPAPVELTLGASVENQPSIELIVGELGSETGGTEVYFDGDRLVTRCLGDGETAVQPLNDRDGSRTIAQLNPAGYPGKDRIKVLFSVDEQRCLRMTVEDLLTQATLAENQIVAQLS